MNYILKNPDIDTDINVQIHVQNLKNKYLEEYQKNKIIMDSLKNLDNNEKKEYLSRIYQQTNMDFTKTNIDINELKLPNENNIALELPNNISDNYLSLYPSENVGLFEGAIYSDNQVENAPQLKKRYPN